VTSLRLPEAGQQPGAGDPQADPVVTRSRWAKLRGRLTGVACVLLLVIIASVAGWLPMQLMRVGSDSMAPTTPTGSLVVVDRWSGPVERMDVVAVEPLDGEGPMLVKRAVAVGGDEVAIEDGVLVVNGAPVCEPTIDPLLIDAEYFGPVTVPAGHLFLLGDNRANSIDSREFGTVPADDVRGHVVLRLWPSPGGLDLAAEGC
jgi:signal peptidase I